MKRHVRWWSLLAVVVLVLGGCSSGTRASDPAGTAVREARSSVAGLVLAVQLLLDHRAIPTVTQVSLEQTREDVAAAQQELVTASDADPHRRAVATAAVQVAADTLVALGQRGAADLGASDLERLEQAERALAAAAKDLQA